MNPRREYWNRRTSHFSRPHARLRLIRDLIEALPEPVSTLLDVGCGGAALQRLLPGHIEYFGVDIASEVITAQRDTSHFEVADLEEGQDCFAGRQFDVVVCSGVFEYIQRRDRFLEFVRSKTAARGHLILSFTNRHHYRDLLGIHRYEDPHVNFIPIPDLIRLLDAHGFQVNRYTSITAANRRPPLLARCIRFPLSLFNRLYLFVCSRPASSSEAVRHRGREAGPSCPGAAP